MPQPTTTVDSAKVVRQFLEALAGADFDTARSLLSDDAEWINVSLPVVRGADQIDKLCRLFLGRLRIGFRVHFHHVLADGETVLTERDDALVFGPIEQRFWVWGRFVVRDGRIVTWRDSFDWRDYLVGLLRGIAGTISPRLNRTWPSQR